MLSAKVLFGLLCWAVQGLFFRLSWPWTSYFAKMAVTMGKRPAWVLRIAVPISSVIGLGLVLVAGWLTEAWAICLALWPLVTMVMVAEIIGYMGEPVSHFREATWCVVTMRWRRAFELLSEMRQVATEWDTWQEYQQIREREGEEEALKWLAMMTREHPFSYRVPAHFDPELARKVEEIDQGC